MMQVFKKIVLECACNGQAVKMIIYIEEESKSKDVKDYIFKTIGNPGFHQKIQKICIKKFDINSNWL